MSPPFLIVLSYSGGAQSTLLLEMVLRGEIEKPFRFLVLNSDPGMEDNRTYRRIREMRARCAERGIDFITASGPNLYNDIVNTRFNAATRMDNPPYWTRDMDGKRGKLRQKCTQHYKIAPMDRALRGYLLRNHNCGPSALRPGLVEKWIGFAADEWHRCSESDVQYIRLRYPLIEMGYDRAKCSGWYLSHGVAQPPRSVCSGCCANGLDYFKEMHDTRPDEWEKAVEIDNALETWKGRITEQEVFVSGSLMRLRDLPAINFGKEREDLEEHHCNSGVCFL